MKRSWLLVAGALVALLATAVFAYGAEAPVPPFDTNAECLQCHSVGTASSAVSKVDFAVSGGVDLAKCEACHKGNYLTYDHPHFTGDCGNCHNNDDAFYFPWPGSRQYPVSTPYGHFLGLASLSATPARLHAVHAQKDSWVSQSFDANYPACAACHAPAACTACHDEPISHGDHAASEYPGRTLALANGVAAPVSTSTCIDPACHSLAAAGTTAFTPSCPSCHPVNTQEHGYEAGMHTADVTSTVEADGKVCGDCHEMELYAEHQRATSASKPAGCGACHPSPRGTFASWGQTCAQAGCHPAGSPTAAHGGVAAGHAPLSAGDSAVCTTCHIEGDLAAIHANAVSTTDATKTSCLVCHSTSAIPSTRDCTTCHFTYANHPYPATSHASSWSLEKCAGAGCHGSRDLLAVHTEKNPALNCATCHNSADTKVVAAVAAGQTGCGDCHSGVTQLSGHDGQHWAGPLLSDGSGPHYGYGTGSASDTPTRDCIGCHTSNLIAEHLGTIDAATGNSIRDARYDSAGNALTCASCHGALPGTLVATAIATGQTGCDACHVTHEQIPATHTSTFVANPAVPCSPCHSSQIELSHDGTYSTTAPDGKVLTGCEVCHGYYAGARGAQVQAGISVTNDTACTACHAAAHPDQGGHSATSTASLGCGGCHSKGQTTIDVRTVHTACATCHENPNRVADITLKTAECGSCHASEGADYHKGLPGKHVYSSMSATCQSSTCHPSNSLPEAHAPYLSRYPQYTSTCDLCHANADSARIPANATAACDSCHTSIHPNMDHTAHNSESCVACHESGDAMELHKTNGQTDCDLCHANPSRIQTLPATTDCVNCHAAISPVDPNHYSAAVHTAADGTEGGTACSVCHSLNMTTEHFKSTVSPTVTCVSCHESKVDGFAASWNKTCAACHATKHMAIATKHVSAKSACAGAGCHVISDVAALHTLTAAKCATCHGSGKTPTTDCGAAGCHANTTGDHEAQHGTVGVVDEGCQGCHFQSLTKEHSALGYTCATCHCSTNPAVVTAIAGGSRSCEACHPSVNGKDFHAPQEAAEFTAGNSSMHRVTAALPGMRSSFVVNATTYSWSLPTASSFLKSGWSTDSIVTCVKCHTYTGAAGPHGATAKVNLDPAYAGDYQTAYLGDSSLTPSNVICSKCHTNLSNSNQVHGEGDHHGSSDGKCILCHSKVPHGWRLPRMLAYTNDPAAYASTGLTGIRLANHTPSNWSENDCATSCGEHSSSMSGRWPSTVNTVGTLRGTVKSSAGVALAGVTVTTDKGQSATTNSLGAYDLGSLPTGAYQVSAAIAGFTSQTKTVTLISNQATVADFTLAAIQPGTLAGSVTAAANGAPLSGVTVQVTGDGSATTGASGAYSLSLMPGTYTITYSLTGYVSQSKSVAITSSTTLNQNVAMVAVVTSTNVALNDPATASSTYSSTYSASKAFDGSLSSYWRSTSGGTQWLRVDLGTSQSFKRFEADWNGSYYARSYRIETSTDGYNWTSRYSTSYGNGDSTVTLSSPVTARYVRLYCTSANSSNYQVTEFKVWNQ